MFSKRSQRIAASASIAIGLAVGAAGISAAATSPSSPSKPAVTNPAPGATQPATQPSSQPSAKSAEPVDATETDAGKPDTDNVQQGPGDTSDTGPEVPGK